MAAWSNERRSLSLVPTLFAPYLETTVGELVRIESVDSLFFS